jgi:hypothetical protein
LRRRIFVGAGLALPLMLTGGLAGCSMLRWSGGSGAAAAQCPAPVIMAPLRQTAVFAPGAAREPLGVAFYGVLDDATAKCDENAGTLRLSLDIVVIGQRGPAAGGGTFVDLQYFMAVTGPGETLLRKRSFAVRIPIPTDRPRAGVTDHIEEVIPLEGRPAGQLGIIVGFQQSPEVVEFYRHFRGR